MASAGVSIKIEGMDRLQRRLSGMPKRIQNKCLRKALRSAANKGKARLKPPTPLRLGAAQRALGVSVRVSGAQAFAKVRYKGKPGFYMRLYDQGSSRQPARPFFTAALTGYEREVQQDFSTALRDAVETAEAAL